MIDQYAEGTHLNQFERSKIEVLTAFGYSPYALTKMINRYLNTVRSELKRGTVPKIKTGKITSSYFAQTDQTLYAKKRKNCGSKYKLLKCERFIDHVYKLFYENKHSSDSITGSCRKSGSFAATEMVCSKTLYNYTFCDYYRIKFSIMHCIKNSKVTRSL